MKKLSKSQTVNEKVNVREILPRMVQLSNNSPITQSTARAIMENLSSVQINDFKRWLQLVDQNCSNRSRRF